MTNFELHNSTNTDENNSSDKILNVSIVFAFIILTLASAILLCGTLYELVGILERKKAKWRESRHTESVNSGSPYACADALEDDESLQRASEQESLEEFSSHE